MNLPGLKLFCRKNGILVILVVAAFVQLAIIFSDYGRVWSSRILRSTMLNSMERSSLFMLGGKATSYLRLILETASPDGTVVLPEGAGELSQQNTLEFYLMPRRIPSCLCPKQPSNYSEYCMACLQEPSHVVLSIGSFPIQDVVDGKQFIHFEGGDEWFHGLYIPMSQLVSQAGNTIFDQRLELSRLSIDMLLLLGIFSLGYLVYWAFSPTAGWVQVLPFSFPLGAGSITLPIFLVSWAGIPLNLITILFVLAGLILILGMAERGHLLNRLRQIPLEIKQLRDRYRSEGLLRSLPVAGMLLLLVFSVFIAVGRSYSLFDPIANWALKGYAIALEGSIFAGAKWGGHGLSYPQNIHLLIAMFKLASGDLLPTSKVIFPLLAFSLVSGIYLFLLSVKFDRLLASLVSLLLYSTPIFFYYATVGYANLPLTAYLVLGCLLLIQGYVLDEDGRLYLGSLMLGFAAWTRAEGFAFALPLVFGLFLTGYLTRLQKPGFRTLIPVSLISGTWLVFARLYANTEYASYFGGGSGGSWLTRLNPGAIIDIFKYGVRHMADPLVWGGFPYLCLIFIALLVVRRKQSHDAEFRYLFVGFLIVGLLTFMLFWGASTSWLTLRHDYDRFSLPLFSMLFLFSSFAFADQKIERLTPGD